MCKWGTKIGVNVKIQADLSCDGKEKWKEVQIDSCIALIVKGLQSVGIDMLGSCCGHSETLGDISLVDGRILLIVEKERAKDFFVKSRALFFFKIAIRQLWYEVSNCWRYVRKHIGWLLNDHLYR